MCRILWKFIFLDWSLRNKVIGSIYCWVVIQLAWHFYCLVYFRLHMSIGIYIFMMCITIKRKKIQYLLPCTEWVGFSTVGDHKNQSYILSYKVGERKVEIALTIYHNVPLPVFPCNNIAFIGYHSRNSNMASWALKTPDAKSQTKRYCGAKLRCCADIYLKKVTHNK